MYNYMYVLLLGGQRTHTYTKVIVATRYHCHKLQLTVSIEVQSTRVVII